MRYICLLLLTCVCVILPGQAWAELIQAKHIQVELVSEYDSIRPGANQYLALRFVPEANWHVYWKYHGDSGLPPKITWKNPRDLNVGPVEWPIPKKISIGHLSNYGYDREVYLPMALQAGMDLSAAMPIQLQAEVSWLVCQEECIPGEATLNLTLAVNDNPQPTQHAAQISTAIDNTALKTDLTVISARASGDKEIVLEVLNNDLIKLTDSGYTFFPDGPRQIENAAPQLVAETQNGIGIILQKPRNAGFPSQLSGILVSESGWTDNRQQALQFTATVEGAPTDATVELLAQSAVDNGAPDSLLLSIWFALLGGLILNLMPCVFPILSIKILGFVKLGDERKSATVKHALSFAAGVLVSFWFLAGLLILLRTAGNAIGWGFQLQSPTFVLAMIFLMVAIGLNLIGFFDFGSGLQNLAGRQTEKHGLTGSFLSGVLATALATPCTAPFMASALAAALSRPLFEAFLIFTALAGGMALPYVILSTNPSLLKVLPRPGAWMEKLKQFLAFPMFATALWLVSVYAAQLGIDATIYLLFALLLFILTIWLLNNFSGKLVRKLIVPVMFGFSIMLALPNRSNNTDVVWEKFSIERQVELTQQNRPVFIDFTAEWCLTCKLNKYTVLSSSVVQDEFQKKNVALLQADWTNLDESITAAIESYGRSGVPLNVLYYGEKDRYYVFPSLLTRAMVLEQLALIK